MLVPPKKRKEPMTQSNSSPIPMKMQTRSMTEEKKKQDDEWIAIDKELRYYRELKFPPKTSNALIKPKSASEYAKNIFEDAENAYDELVESLENPEPEPQTAARSKEEALHELAVLREALGNYK